MLKGNKRTKEFKSVQNGIMFAALEMELRSMISGMETVLDPSLAADERCAAFFLLGRSFEELQKIDGLPENADQAFEKMITTLYNLLSEDGQEYGNRAAA